MAIKKLPKLEPKNRTYILLGKSTPISYVLKSKNTKFNPLLYFDGEKNRAMRYSPNQKSIFEDSQDTNVILEPIIFQDGTLKTKSEETNLQLFLHLHPDNKVNGGRLFSEFNPELNAQSEVDSIDLQFEALKTARELDFSDLEAIARVVKKATGENIDKMTSSEIKRDMYNYAKSYPEDFLRLANDTDIKLRNLAIRAVDTGIISLRDDNTNFYWGDTKRKVLTVPFGDNPYTHLSSFFKTDDGIDTMKAIIDKLK